MITKDEMRSIGFACAEFVVTMRRYVRTGKKKLYAKASGSSKLNRAARSPISEARRLIARYGEDEASRHTNVEEVRLALMEEIMALRHARKLRRAVEPFRKGMAVRDVEAGLWGVVEDVDPEYGTVMIVDRKGEDWDIDARYLEVCHP